MTSECMVCHISELCHHGVEAHCLALALVVWLLQFGLTVKRLMTEGGV